LCFRNCCAVATPRRVGPSTSGSCHTSRSCVDRLTPTPQRESRCGRALGVDAVLGELQLEVLAIHPHLLGGPGDVAGTAGERVLHEAALEALDETLLGILKAERTVAGGELGVSAGRRPDRRGQVVDADLRSAGERHRLLDRLLELADVPLSFVAE